jgi:hypothetical protein
MNAVAYVTEVRAVLRGGGGEQRQRIHLELQEHQEGEQERAGEQQRRLHDLDPRGRDHAPEQHVGQHHDADNGHGDVVFEAEEQAHQVARPHHLRDQVEGHHGQRSDGRGDAHRRLAQPRRHDVGERVAPQIAERLGDEEHDDRPADQEADRVDQAVESRERHQPGDAEKARRAHVVAGQRHAVLEPRDAAPRGVELVRALRPPGRPVGDRQRAGDEDQEPGDGGEIGLADRTRAGVHRGSAPGRPTSRRRATAAS